MTKKELAASIEKKSGASKKDIEAVINALCDTIIEELANGRSVTISGFGTFEVHKRAEKKGVNPRTKEAVIIPAGKSPAFKAGKAMKDAVK